ncbi:MAG: ABC transporter permease [Candidatus Treponema excrementipullorum]|nr:ABC transporter permease [Spirochaetia bacterium]MCI7588797.1 ABC transporter permease [Spirochaetia bacterium]MDD7012531.1 ABC transporter permease [Candidatus Treponema excrementipullorum]MDY2755044.1 ABC transporter permease [Candidatus Treponema excrementipullorum]MDY4707810.1 ABC transporter permease [Candidatus Treponema excrementipullorum]
MKQNKLKKNPGPVYAWPMGLWFTVFFVVPLLIILVYSFLKKALYGGVDWQFSLEAYRQMFNPNYAIVLFRTIKLSLISTLITILLALPCGYAVARSSKQTLILILIMIPFWTNSLIRIFAWMSILSSDGVLSSLLRQWGILKETTTLLYNQGAVVLVSVYMYLPYAILPIFTSIDRFDFSLLEAARDLGATKAESMFKVLLPSIKTGIITAIIFTFIPIFGAYTVPLLVGGKDSYMIGNIIVDQINKTRNWPLAAAFSLVITVLSMLGVLWMLLSNKKDANLRIAKEGKK